MRMVSGAAAVVIVVFVSSAASASAQHTVNAEQACTPDAMRLCSEFIPDEKKITACLRRHRGALSADCRKVFGGGKRATKRRHRHGAS